MWHVTESSSAGFFYGQVAGFSCFAAKRYCFDVSRDFAGRAFAQVLSYGSTVFEDIELEVSHSFKAVFFLADDGLFVYVGAENCVHAGTHIHAVGGLEEGNVGFCNSILQHMLQFIFCFKVARIIPCAAASSTANFISLPYASTRSGLCFAITRPISL